MADNATVADDAANEPTQAEQDALLSAQDGINGTLTENSPKEAEDGTDDTTEDTTADEGETAESGDDSAAADGSTAGGTESGDSEDGGTSTDVKDQSASELVEEKDEAGVYTPAVVTDPGEFQPNDYTFEIKTTDGKTHTIHTPEDAYTLAEELDKNPDLTTASAFMQLSSKTALMERGLADDKRTYETQKAEFDAKKALDDTRDTTLTQWNNEINYLANNGELPAISEELNRANWSDPEVAKDPAVKARLEVFKWMETENSKRLSAGLEPIRSVIDAHTAMQLETMKQANQATVSREKETRQKKGSMVGGASAYQPSNVPTGTIIGPGGSLDDLVSDFMNQ